MDAIDVQEPPRERELHPNARIQFPDSLVIAALHKHRGRLYLAAAELGCHPDTLATRIKVLPELKGIRQLYRKHIVDKAEQSLEEHVDNGDAWAVQFALKTIGKDRGYVERTETHNQTDLKAAVVQFLQPQQTAGLLGLAAPVIDATTLANQLEGGCEQREIGRVLSAQPAPGLPAAAGIQEKS